MAQHRPAVLAILNAISIGTIINLVIMSFSQYYVCDPVFETTTMVVAISCDALRYVAGIAAIVLSMPSNAEDQSLGPSPGKGFSTAAAASGMSLISAAVLITSIVIWKDACDNCVQREEQDTYFQSALGDMLNNHLQQSCTTGQSQWFNPQTWCRAELAVNCKPAFFGSNIEDIKSVQTCVRWGCSDFLPESQWSYFFEILGDVSRVVLFYMIAVDSSGDTVNNSDDTDNRPPAYASAPRSNARQQTGDADVSVANPRASGAATTLALSTKQLRSRANRVSAINF